MLSYLNDLLTLPDRLLVERVAGWQEPDLVITAENGPYLLRWYVIPRNTVRNVYFHVQVTDDQDRALHDHPWDNTSIVLAGGYEEHMPSGVQLRLPGVIVHRRAQDLHRLVLLGSYSISLFVTGPTWREWGFMMPDGWKSYQEITETRNGVSKMKST